MKNLFIIIAAFAFVSMTSCNGKTSAVIESKSPNEKVKVRVEGTRGIPFDPFKTVISVKAYEFKEGKLTFEIMASDLNSENVKFDWVDDSNCTISIEESDKNVRSFQLIANENQVQLAEI